MTRLPNAVQRFLDGLSTGDWDGMEQHVTPDAVLDGSMPGWRCQYEGPERIVGEYRDWTAEGPWRVHPTITQASDTVVVELQLDLLADTDTTRCRFASVFGLRDGQIAEHRYYCAGDWDEATVRRIEDEAPKVERQATRA